jgi:seryl-tRNA synthetase
VNAPFKDTNNFPHHRDADRDGLAAALFEPMGVDGIYARTALYETVVEKLSALISRAREEGTEVLRFPPVMSRRQLEKSGYLKSFPNLLGCVCALHGSEADIHAAVQDFDRGRDWTRSLSSADLVLSPAACYPVYPIAAARGPIPGAGYLFDIAADVFRHEPSTHIDRFQSFRMREYVCIGGSDMVAAFRERWMDKGRSIADELMLPYALAQASDPFFGRVGQMKAVAQLQASLKFELLVPVRSAEQPTACMSFNCHREHFGAVWEMTMETGEPAHSGCVAFGMDRLAVALFATHGLDVERWPERARHALGL